MSNLNNYKKIINTTLNAFLFITRQAKIMNHLANKGPLAVGIDASNFAKEYRGGVYDPCSFSDVTHINHGKMNLAGIIVYLSNISHYIKSIK